MNRGAIQAGFDALLATITNGGRIRVQDGTVFVPDEGQPFLAGQISAYNRQPLGIGPNTPFQFTGSYTITIYRPASEGTANAAAMAEIILQVFARGLLVAAGTSAGVQIFNASEQQLLTSADWVTLPVVVSWMGNDQS